jgi:iron complex transport system ATP-binding protein
MGIKQAESMGMMQENYILEAEDVSFSYRNNDNIINGITFSMKRGEIAAIAGPNGVGKSTILKIICGYLKPKTGRVLLENKNVDEYDNLARCRLVAAVPQNIYAPIPFTVEQVIKMGRLARLSRFSRLSTDDYLLIAETMKKLEIESFAKRAIGELSGGERQRVMIATALAQDPHLLLLDEPTSHLDIGNSAKVIKSLMRWRNEKSASILIVTHDVQMAARICDRIVLMKNGNILADGNPHQVLTEDVLFEAYGHSVSTFISPRDGMPVILPDLS